MNLKIEYLNKEDLRPYINNAKIHTAEQIEQIKNSIRQFGFNDPIAVWHDNEIIEGHGRLLAVMEMPEITDVPIIRLDNLTDEQRKAYTLIHNKLTMNTGFDVEMLNAEIASVADTIDLSQFDLEIEIPETKLDIDVPASLRYNTFENQEKMQFPSENYYGIPDMTPTDTVGDKFLRFADWKDVDDYSEYIAHFYYDDYKFIQAWRTPDKYIDRLSKFKAIISPDFSLYTDFPRALQILSCYRRQWCGAYWQSLGLDVIPDVVWGDEASFDYCFEGIPKGGTVAVSSVGVARDGDWNNKSGDMFKAGYDEMMRRIQPTTVLFYGDIIDGLEGNIIQIPSFYAEKRAYLNERAREKKNGPRQQ